MKKITFLILLTILFGIDSSFAQYYQWSNKIGDTLTDKVHSIAVDKIGNVIITGEFIGHANFNQGGTLPLDVLSNSNTTDIFIAKYDQRKDSMFWAIAIGGSSVDIGRSVFVDTTGNIYVTGQFQGVNINFNPHGTPVNLTSLGGSTDIFLAKYNTVGNCLWAKRIGGPQTDIGRSITADGAGNVYITGEFRAVVDFDPGAGSDTLRAVGGPGNSNSDIFIAKFDSNGNHLFAKSVGSPLSDIGKSITVKGSGIYLTGEFQDSANYNPGGPPVVLTSAGNSDIFVAKYNAGNLNLNFAKRMGGIGADTAGGIALDYSGFIYLTGNFQNTATFDTSTIVSVGGNDIYLAKYDTSGTEFWAKSAGGPLNDIGNGVATDSNFVYIAGDYTAVVDFDAVHLPSTPLPGSGSDIYFAKYDVNGNCHTALNIAGFGYDDARTIAVDRRHSIYVAGGFIGNVDFDASLCRDTLASNAGPNSGPLATDIFFTKYNDQPPLAICMATVDAASASVIILWEKPPLPTNIAAFKIFRENSNHIFDSIATVPYDSLSEYIDTGIDPNQESFVYKLSVLFTNGSESPRSNSHETMHLDTIIQSGNDLILKWNAYCGFGISKYDIWIDTLGTGTFYFLDSVPLGSNVDTIYNASHPYAWYRILTPDTTGGCTPTRSEYSGSLSNIRHISFTPVSIKEYNNESIAIVPNPSSGNFTVTNYNKNNLDAKIIIYNMYGASVKEVRQNPNSSSTIIDLSEFSSGVYFMEYKTSDYSVQKKIVLQK